MKIIRKRKKLAHKVFDRKDKSIGPCTEYFIISKVIHLYKAERTCKHFNLFYTYIYLLDFDHILQCRLETTLRKFSCLTTGDTIMVTYNNKRYYLDIIETKPAKAISIIETDCEVDFAPSLDYKDLGKPNIADKTQNKGVFMFLVCRFFRMIEVIFPQNLT